MIANNKNPKTNKNKSSLFHNNNPIIIETPDTIVICRSIWLCSILIKYINNNNIMWLIIYKFIKILHFF